MMATELKIDFDFENALEAYGDKLADNIPPDLPDDDRRPYVEKQMDDFVSEYVSRLNKEDASYLSLRWKHLKATEVDRILNQIFI